MPRASAQDAAATARRILDVATARFAEHGYAAVSADDIALAAGVTRGALYHHYRSKPGLFAAVASEQQRLLARAIETATDGLEAVAAVHAGSHAFLDAITQGAAVRVLLVDGPTVLSWDQWRHGDAEGPETELRAGLAEVGVAPGLGDALAAGLSGAMNELALWVSRRPEDATAREQAHRTLDLLLTSMLRNE